MQRRRAADEYLAAWFSWEPKSYPVPQIAANPASQENMPVTH
jgi:hypothetical protein